VHCIAFTGLSDVTISSCKTYNIFKMQKLMFKHHLMSCRDKHVIAWKSFEIRDGKYYEDEPIIDKLSEFKKTQIMKNQHVLL
jgi:hypothetical protein